MCGIIGIIGEEYACDTVLDCLPHIQGRGLEASSVATIVDGQPRIFKKGGVVENLSKSFQRKKIPESIAVGSVRYGTAGGSCVKNTHPFKPKDSNILLVHNGEILGAKKMKKELRKSGAIFISLSDTEVLLRYLERETKGPMIDRIFQCLDQFPAAYSIVIQWNGHLIGACDKQAMHPLVLGQFPNGGYIFASEDVAIKAVGARKIKHLKPGQVISISPDLQKSEFWLDGKEINGTAHCAFNLVYTARPDGTVWDRSVSQAREALGAQTFKEHLAAGLPEVDMIVPVLDSGREATLAYAKEYFRFHLLKLIESGAGLEAIRRIDINSLFGFGFGINRNRSGRTFMEPEQGLREKAVTIKHSGNSAIVKGRRILVGDDTIVRGTTSKLIVQMLRDLGAEEVHFVVFAPPVINSCPYGGTETKDVKRLIGANMNIEQIRDTIGVDSLFYPSIEGFKGVIDYQEKYCMHCFGCEQPVPVPQP